ncbi:MAG: serine/threonine protein kinase [Methylococcales bacterium]|jgi:eukaryotic-like serine/threonine-protein kinase|nr:serine/threonine protein kinase [Methylococcales bacterium]
MKMRTLHCNDKDVFLCKSGVYEISKLSEGGTANLFKGKCLSDNNKLVTFKILKKELAEHEKTRKQFFKECKLLSIIKHPHIPKLIEYGQSSDSYYIAYEYIDGISTLELLQFSYRHKHGVAPPIAAHLLRSLLSILRYLHTFAKHPIVHGDISPDNLLFSPKGEVHLLDFGCIQQIKTGESKYSPWLGKPSYLSPEQAKALPWDHRSDVYQAGVIFYELLTGQKYISGKTSRDCVLIAANPPKKDFSKVLPGMNQKLYNILGKFLASNINERYQSADEAYTDLSENCPKDVQVGILNRAGVRQHT